MSAPLVWWTDQGACEAIQKAFGWRGPPEWPNWLADEFASREGRSGRCRLWTPSRFSGKVAINESLFESTVFGRWIVASSMGGIVIDAESLALVIWLPGVVTDVRLGQVSS